MLPVCQVFEGFFFSQENGKSYTCSRGRRGDLAGAGQGSTVEVQDMPAQCCSGHLFFAEQTFSKTDAMKCLLCL